MLGLPLAASTPNPTNNIHAFMAMVSLIVQCTNGSNSTSLWVRCRRAPHGRRSRVSFSKAGGTPEREAVICVSNVDAQASAFTMGLATENAMSAPLDILETF